MIFFFFILPFSLTFLLSDPAAFLWPIDNPHGVCPHKKSDLSRRETWELPGGPTWLQKATHHSHHRLWPGKRIHWSRDEETHPVQRTQESDWNRSIHEHQYTPRERWDRCSMCVGCESHQPWWIASKISLHSALAWLHFSDVLLFY